MSDTRVHLNTNEWWILIIVFDAFAFFMSISIIIYVFIHNICKPNDSMMELGKISRKSSNITFESSSNAILSSKGMSRKDYFSSQ